MATKSTLRREQLCWRTMAEMLCQCVQQRYGYRYDRKLPDWAKQFKGLHETDGAPMKELWAVLRWYCTASDRGGAPDCYTANMFRGAFGWIRDEYLKTQPNRGGDEWETKAGEAIVSYVLVEHEVNVAALAKVFDAVSEWYDVLVPMVPRDPTKYGVLLRVLNFCGDGTDMCSSLAEHIQSTFVDGMFLRQRGTLAPFFPGGSGWEMWLEARGRRATEDSYLRGHEWELIRLAARKVTA